MELGEHPPLQTTDRARLSSEVVEEAEHSETALEPSSRFKIRNRLGRWAVAGVGGMTAGFALLHMTQPSVERQLGAVRVGLSADSNGGVEVMGEDLDGPIGIVGVNANLEAPYTRDIADSVAEASVLGSEIRKRPNEQLINILEERYNDDLRSAGLELALRSGLLVVLTGGVVFAGLNERLKSNNVSGRPIGSMLGGSLAALVLFSANLGITYQTFDTPAAGREMDRALTPQIESFFTDKTTKVVIDYKKISEEISRNLIRLDRYGETMSLSRMIDPNLSWVVVSADEHLRAPYEEEEAIDRVFGANMNIYLGDFINRSSDTENSVLSGPEIFGVDFEGIQDIRSCEAWSPTDPTHCEREGDRIPGAFVLSNHDNTKTANALEKLGIKNVHMRIFEIPGVEGVFAAAGDGCFASEADCHSSDGDAKANQEVGRVLKAMLEEKGVRPQALFVAHHETALELDGVSPTIFVGELHRQFTATLPKGSTVYSVGTIGQAFGREADEASVVVAGFNPDTGVVEDCRAVAWQSLNASVPPTVRLCDEIVGEL